jgi:peptidoglycan/xylan/chitin deacetylase (PgdA/CDA1 family)
VRPDRVIGGIALAAVLVGGCLGATIPSATVAPSASIAPGPSPTVTVSSTPLGSSAVVSEAPSSVPTATATPSRPSSPRPSPTPTITVRPTTRPTATPRPTPRPTVTPASSRLVTHGPRTSHAVAVTFDMGGRVGDARAIVGWLIDHDVPASIFMTGAMADTPNTDAGRQVLAAIDAHPGLLTLGNHSYTHRDVRSLSAAAIAEELARTEAAFARWCSQDPRPFFRPPYGGQDADALAAIGAAGYGSTVTWDIDTIDWRPIDNDPPGPTADQIVANVLDRARGGSIVAMHLGGYETLDALPRVVSGLRAAGFELVTLASLLD